MTVTGKAERQPGAGIQMQVQEGKAAGPLPLITPFHHFCLCGVGCGVLENQPCKLLILLDVWWRWRLTKSNLSALIFMSLVIHKFKCAPICAPYARG